MVVLFEYYLNDLIRECVIWVFRKIARIKVGFFFGISYNNSPKSVWPDVIIQCIPIRPVEWGTERVNLRQVSYLCYHSTLTVVKKQMIYKRAWMWG